MQEKPSDFITVEEAIALINTDTRDNPTVDDVRLVKALPFLDTNMRGGTMNYTIHLIKRDETGKIVDNGKKFAQVQSSRDANTLKYAIIDHYKALSGRDIDPDELGVSRQTTTIEEGSGFQSKPRINTESKIKVGDDLKTGTGNVVNGE